MADNQLQISAEMADLINNALMSGNWIVVSYADAQGQPHLSYRGSTHVHSDDQIGIWVRDANGGFPTALSTNPKVALLYRNQEAGAMFVFSGRAHVDPSADVRERVYEESPEREQAADPERKGVAVIVDVDEIQGRSPSSGFFKVARG